MNNPILAGMHPDPSWIWDELREEAVLVNSSFELTPGLPIHVSRDLAHWTHVADAVRGDLAKRLFLDVAGDSGGLYAPTLRRIRGRYVIVCTTMRIDGDAALAAGHTQAELDAMNAARGNFVITAETIEGPWEGPYWVAGAHGIDPDVFEDRDGTVFWTQTRPAADPQWDGQTEVWTQPIDPETWRLAAWPDGGAGKVILWRGYGLDAVWAEGPHLYRFGGSGPDGDCVYLMTAEGGTGPEHSEMIMRAYAPSGFAAAVSRFMAEHPIDGPLPGERCVIGTGGDAKNRLFRACKRNPILTHRHLGADYPVQCVGHADLLHHPGQGWWLTCLGVRESAKEHVSYLGRETFVAPVVWESGWPVVAPGLGRLPERVGETEMTDEPFGDRVVRAGDPELLYVRGDGSLPYVRVDRLDFTVIAPAAGGLSLRQNDAHSVDVTIDADGRIAVGRRHGSTAGEQVAGSAVGSAMALAEPENTAIGLRLHDDRLTVFACPLPDALRDDRDALMLLTAGMPENATIVADLPAAFLSAERAGGFVGCLAGVDAADAGRV